MCWAVLFLPPYIMQLTNLEISVLWYIGSGRISRLTICAFLGIQKTSNDREDSNPNSRSKLPVRIGCLEFPQPGLAPGYRAKSLRVELSLPDALIPSAASRHTSSAIAC